MAAAVVCAAAILPYVSTLDDYFVRDDFGVVQLLAQKPASYFPRWFYTSWMDRIWGFTPDEVRPFPALSYQLTALGGAASPVLHHAANILLHAANGLLVMAIARTALSMRTTVAAFAGVLFALMPVHTESVAWITGRVDSMPAFFYLASFLAYARWRQSGSRHAWPYAASVLLFFAALFTKQNTITMIATLGAYDVLVLRRAPWPVVRFVLPYVPFALMTAGYLALRYILFGQVAREGSFDAQGLALFGELFERHFTHVVTGHPCSSPLVLAIVLGAAVAAIVPSARGRASVFLYYGPVWWLIGIAPVAVAGYSSPRHVYLAAVGWALVLAMVLEYWLAAPPRVRRAAIAVALAVLAVHGVQLRQSVREWSTIADVSAQAVRDVRAAALAAPDGSLLVVGAPTRSWEWALPFAVQPPFTRTDLGDRVTIVSPRALSCCRQQWFDDTRAALQRWSTGPNRDVVVALRWDPESGALDRTSNVDNPELPIVLRSFVAMPRAEDLDENLQRVVKELTK
jgi:hypothetical protein